MTQKSSREERELDLCRTFNRQAYNIMHMHITGTNSGNRHIAKGYQRRLSGFKVNGLSKRSFWRPSLQYPSQSGTIHTKLVPYGLHHDACEWTGSAPPSNASQSEYLPSHSADSSSNDNLNSNSNSNSNSSRSNNFSTGVFATDLEQKEPTNAQNKPLSPERLDSLDSSMDPEVRSNIPFSSFPENEQQHIKQEPQIEEESNQNMQAPVQQMARLNLNSSNSNSANQMPFVEQPQQQQFQASASSQQKRSTQQNTPHRAQRAQDIKDKYAKEIQAAQQQANNGQCDVITDSTGTSYPRSYRDVLFQQRVATRPTEMKKYVANDILPILRNNTSPRDWAAFARKTAEMAEQREHHLFYQRMMSKKYQQRNRRLRQQQSEEKQREQREAQQEEQQRIREREEQQQREREEQQRREIEEQQRREREEQQRREREEQQRREREEQQRREREEQQKQRQKQQRRKEKQKQKQPMNALQCQQQLRRLKKRHMQQQAEKRRAQEQRKQQRRKKEERKRQQKERKRRQLEEQQHMQREQQQRQREEQQQREREEQQQRQREEQQQQLRMQQDERSKLWAQNSRLEANNHDLEEQRKQLRKEKIILQAQQAKRAAKELLERRQVQFPQNVPIFDLSNKSIDMQQYHKLCQKKGQSMNLSHPFTLALLPILGDENGTRRIIGYRCPVHFHSFFRNNPN